MNAFCNGCRLSSLPSPSIVSIAPLTVDIGVTQERTGRPSTSTVHAPHCARPQPNLGPFSSRSLRRTYSRGVSGSTATSRVAPFTRRVKLAIASSLGEAMILVLFLEGDEAHPGRHRRVVVTVDPPRRRRERAAHREPHDELDRLRAGFFHDSFV